MNESLLVTAAIIERNGKYLITQRPYDKHLGGMWEFPGGKLEDGETLEKGLEREIMEELGIAIVVGPFFGKSEYTYPDGPTIDLRGYVCDNLEDPIRNIEIRAHKWVTPSEMASYDMPKADLPFVDKLMDENR